jgi:hypothetical protein
VWEGMRVEVVLVVASRLSSSSSGPWQSCIESYGHPWMVIPGMGGVGWLEALAGRASQDSWVEG